jgi:hypothetical protein
VAWLRSARCRNSTKPPTICNNFGWFLRSSPLLYLSPAHQTYTRSYRVSCLSSPLPTHIAVLYATGGGGGTHIQVIFKVRFSTQNAKRTKALVTVIFEVLFLHIFNVQADPEAPAEEVAPAGQRRQRSPPPATGRGRRLGRGGRQPRNAPVSMLSKFI